MTETHSEDRHAAERALDEVARDPGVLGVPGPGETTRCVNGRRENLPDRTLVVAHDLDAGAAALEQVREIPGEGIVVIEEQHPACACGTLDEVEQDRIEDEHAGERQAEPVCRRVRPGRSRASSAITPVRGSSEVEPGAAAQRREVDSFARPESARRASRRRCPGASAARVPRLRDPVDLDADGSIPRRRARSWSGRLRRSRTLRVRLRSRARSSSKSGCARTRGPGRRSSRSRTTRVHDAASRSRAAENISTASQSSASGHRAASTSHGRRESRLERELVQRHVGDAEVENVVEVPASSPRGTARAGHRSGRR